MYEQVCLNIIRPLRQQYRIGRLGPTDISVKSKLTGMELKVAREDDIVINGSGQRLHLSYFNIKNSKSKAPCVVYLHANNGSRSQGIPYVKPLLQQEISVCLFDSAGSGLSDGEFITLGIRQSDDLAKVVEYLKTKKGVRDIGLWGRSMGAVAALMYCSRNTQQIRACVYDSPFSSLRKLVKELGRQKTGIPEFFFQVFMAGLDQEMTKRANIGLKDLDLKERVGLIRTPAVFVTSNNDTLVKSEHTQQLYELYPVEKYLYHTDSQHHQSRPAEIVQICISFLKNKFSNQTVVTPMTRSVEDNNVRRSTPENSVSINLVNSVRPIHLNSKLNVVQSGPESQKQNTPTRNHNPGIQNRFKATVPVEEERDSFLCFLREGCWQRPQGRKLLRPSDQERHSGDGVRNWKTMVQKNQRLGEEQKTTKPLVSKVSLKRILDQSSLLTSGMHPHVQTPQLSSRLQQTISTLRPSPQSQASLYVQRRLTQQAQRTPSTKNINVTERDRVAQLRR